MALPHNAFTLKYTLPFRRAEEKAGEAADDTVQLLDG